MASQNSCTSIPSDDNESSRSEANSSQQASPSTSVNQDSSPMDVSDLENPIRTRIFYNNELLPREDRDFLNRLTSSSPLSSRQPAAANNSFNNSTQNDSPPPSYGSILRQQQETVGNNGNMTFMIREMRQTREIHNRIATHIKSFPDLLLGQNLFFLVIFIIMFIIYLVHTWLLNSNSNLTPIVIFSNNISSILANSDLPNNLKQWFINHKKRM